MSDGRNPLRYLVFSLFLILAACRQATPPTTPAPVPTPRPGTLLVAPDTNRGTLSPYLLGSNYGPWVAVPVAMQAELWQLTSEQQPQAATTVTLPAGGQRTLPAQSVSLYILNP